MVDDVGGCSQARCHESLHPRPIKAGCCPPNRSSRERRTRSAPTICFDQRVIEAAARTARPCRIDGGNQIPMFSGDLTKAGTCWSRPSPPASRRVRPSCCRPPGCRAPRRCSTPPSCSARSRTPPSGDFGNTVGACGGRMPAESSTNAEQANWKASSDGVWAAKRQEPFRRHAESGEPIGNVLPARGGERASYRRWKARLDEQRWRRHKSPRGGRAEAGAVTAAPFVDRARSARCPLPRADSRCDWISVGALADPDRRLKVRQAQTSR